METQGLLRAEDYLKEVIKLQLKKPKNWNWELTTSKSSPHLALPIIQLFDSKGKLLVEAKDAGVNTERRSWHSASVPLSQSQSQIRRSRSEVLKSLDETQAHATNMSKPEKKRAKRSFSNHPLDKISEQEDSTKESSKICDSLKVKHSYRRSRSDDLLSPVFQCWNNGSINLDSVNEVDSIGSVDIDSQYRPPQYELRTSNAGTLLYKRYSFNPTTRRRHRRDGSLGRTSSASSVPSIRSINSWGDKCSRDDVVFPGGGDASGLGVGVGGGDAGKFKDERGRKRRERSRSRALSIERDRDRYPNAGTASTATTDAAATATTTTASAVRRVDAGDNRVRTTDSDEVPPPPPLHHRIRQYRQRIDKLAHSGSGVVGGVSPPPSSTSSEDEGHVDARAATAADMQRDFDHSFRDYKRRQSKAKAFKEITKKVPERPCGRETLGEDVRKMGANVSRHSSKGLSGRRSQSSGSICKSKKTGGGNNPAQPACGSLPSYVESSNNNHDYEKPPINDVDRIPPLGDGAPLHWKFSDNQTVLCDQGYGSERSPEEEFPPPLPEHDNQCNHHLDIHSCYPFITPETTFAVSLAKGSRGLGLSVTGGIDSGGSWPGLIRVKRLFPHQPAAQCGVLNVGDLILEANGVALTGLTNYEALEVLRTASSQVELRLCRPPPDVLNCVSPISEVPPPPPRRELAPLPLTPDQLNTSDDDLNGEFEITMRKIGGSLGFTLRKEDDSALGHYIRALVRDPALNDGRIRPGDKIIAVNNVEISSMTHDEAVNFLRKCGQLVKLRLYRDAAQTPIATLSPTETTPRTSFTKKAQLRQEAMDMLNDIAVRKLLPNTDSYQSHSPLSSPRRIRSRLVSSASDASGEAAVNPNVTTHYYIPEEQFHEGLLQHGGYLPFDEESFNSLFIHDEEEADKPPRPLSLELYNPQQTPVACRKPKFNFSLAHNAYELNNLDAEILDAPNLTYNMNEDVNSTELECEDYPKEPASMPHIPLSDNPGFSHKNPAYQSAHPPCGSGGRENGVSTLEHRKSTSTPPAQTSNTLPREPEKKPRRKKSIIKEPKPPVPDQPEIIAIELNRGWNSRMGFSLQGPVGQTYVSAVYPNSVAFKDGRIKQGDRLIRVNEESVEHMTTSSIIDLLRILRGPVSIVMLREPPPPAVAKRYTPTQIVYKDCTPKASNAVN